jgi:hypothetical protein
VIKPAALAVVLMWPMTGHAADKPEKPDAWFCMQARMHRAQFRTDKAAEDSARAQGASQDTIERAKRCHR